jgi:plastocyanin
VWNNLDGSHTVTARDGSFDSGIFDDGTYRRTFDAAGSYSYFCTLHPEMVGTISVTGGDGSTPPPVDPPPPTTPPTTVVPPSPAPPGDVTIFDNGYTPTTKTVTAGTTVTWSNTGALPHTVTDRAGLFDSSFVMAGETFQRTFDTPGTFSYFCTIHPEMVGTISVEGTDGTAPPPAEPPPEDPAPTAPPTAAPPGDVTIFDNGYTPSNKTITTGTTLVWSNTGALPHTVTDRNGSFDSGFVMAGQTYRRTFNTPGSYSYFCTIHPGMTGSITVNGAATGQPDTGETSDPVPGASDTDLDSSDASTGNDGTDSSTEADGTTPTLSDARISADIIDLDYDPRDLTVERGTTVAWTNIGELPHTVTDVDGTFDSDLMMKGDTYERRFETLGTFNYFCTLHPNMVGTVVVVEAAAATAEEAVATAVVPIDTGTTPQGPSGGSPEAMAIIGFLFVMAAGITGGLGMLARRLLSSTPSSP